MRGRIPCNFEGCRMVESNAENKREHAFGTAGLLHALFDCLQRRSAFIYRAVLFFIVDKKKNGVPRPIKIKIDVANEIEIEIQ